MEILRTEHLTKIYGKDNNEVIAVNDINLSVARGEFVAIVGVLAAESPLCCICLAVWIGRPPGEF